MAKSRFRRRRGPRVLVAGPLGLIGLVGLVGLALIGLAAFVVGWVGWVGCAFQTCPDLSLLGAYHPDGASLLVDRHGRELARLHPQERRFVPLASLPEHVPAAFIAVEDRRFHRHRGVDWPRVVGAGWRNLRAGDIREGASTLTMQLARTLFPERIPGVQRTAARKFLEVVTARRIERELEKDDILELYLNHVYLGAGAYGVEAGAIHYFGRSAVELTPEEAALLAGIARGPALYDPRRNPERAIMRRNLVLSLMEEQGRFSREEAAAARERPLAVTPVAVDRGPSTAAPYFVDIVRRFLEEEVGEALYRSPIRVHTTLDPLYQAAAEEEILRQLEAVEGGRYGPFAGSPSSRARAEERPTGGAATGVEVSTDLQGAVVVLEVETGDVLAMVGGRNFQASRFNRATRARRQTGSAFKPIVYAAALAAGTVTSQPVADRPLVVFQAGSPPWSPRNYDGEFRGLVALRRALVESLNVPTVRLALAVGMDEVGRAARAAGFLEPVPEMPAAALGTGSVSPMELAGVYAGLAGGGNRPEPRLVTRIETADGEVLYERPPEVRPGLDPRVAYILTDVLAEVVDNGTGRAVRAAGFTGPAAGKTGTTQSGHDVWFAGYTPEVAGVVWMGFDQPRPFVAGATGGGLAAPVWGRIMRRVSEAPEASSGVRSWSHPPPGIVERRVDAASGRVLEDGCRTEGDAPYRELFLEEYVPVASCPGGGVRSRVAGFFRGIRDAFRSRGEDEEERRSIQPQPRSEEPDALFPGDVPERLLGAEIVPLSPPELSWAEAPLDQGSTRE
jgi:1A family penicillin-binding protein